MYSSSLTDAPDIGSAKYTLYSFKDEERSSRRLPSFLQWLGLLSGILITGILIKLMYFHRPTTHYNRNHDSELARFVYTSHMARRLPKKGSLFCWVMTSPTYHRTRAAAVNETWLKRCDHGEFFTSGHFGGEGEEDEEEEERVAYAASSKDGVKEVSIRMPLDLPSKSSFVPYSTIFAGIPDTYENLFYKSRYAFYYISVKMKADFDWYLKADDDTYVIVENLRKYLATLDPSKPYYLGFRLKPYLKNGYNGGGAGYVLSREALRLFTTKAYMNETACPDDVFEDVGIARCLASLSIYPHRTVNEKGQQRFNTHRPDEVLHGFHEAEDWIVDKEVKGYSGIPIDLISFHHLTPDEIRLFDVLLYHVTVHKSVTQNVTQL